MKIGTWDRDTVRLLLTSKYRWWGLVLCGVILGALLIGSLLEGVPAAGDKEDRAAALVSSGGPSALWALAATIIVVGLLYGSLWGFHALTRQGRLTREGLDLVRLGTSIRLSSNQTLHVIQFGAQVLLVGSSPAGLVLLAKMPESSSHEMLPNFHRALDDALAREEK
ncbi:MAG: flagellar biosynthetic protein FliO [Anaerolineae bacterium]|nr:flagellar biosynthetic protein FliO [Anaerolineae bacterium]